MAFDQRRGVGMATEMKPERVAAAYGRWAPVYDIVFGLVFTQGRRAAVEAADRISGRILEVGVGTGLSLARYSGNCRIVGIDISLPMVAKARERVRRQRLDHVESIVVLPAERLEYADASFDAVVAQYVVTSIPNPEKALDEFARVVRPGGQIILTSRIGADTGLRGAIEEWLMPVTTRLGWRTKFPWQRYEHWLASSPTIRLVQKQVLPPLGHFCLIRFTKLADDQAHWRPKAPVVGEPEIGFARESAMSTVR
jgi:phosphatidylethanolamine/phosphatidyl-N-methylethanolamine N-methyltransferase